MHLPTNIQLQRTQKIQYVLTHTFIWRTNELIRERQTDQSIAAIRSSLRARMRSSNYHANPEGNKQAATFNRNSKAVQIPDHNDPYKVDWLDMDKEPNVIVGTKVISFSFLRDKLLHLTIASRPFKLQTQQLVATVSVGLFGGANLTTLITLPATNY